MRTNLQQFVAEVQAFLHIAKPNGVTPKVTYALVSSAFKAAPDSARRTVAAQTLILAILTFLHENEAAPSAEFPLYLVVGHQYQPNELEKQFWGYLTEWRYNQEMTEANLVRAVKEGMALYPKTALCGPVCEGRTLAALAILLCQGIDVAAMLSRTEMAS